ncbi:hypothetical protein WMY93_007696 [Mugilogobius chulae]|uniref:USP domain-containing protein n=1 Tax=Mugilogobius chulae TaxID=88201 RepID=A0AAW0PF37_9GOBI
MLHIAPPPGWSGYYNEVMEMPQQKAIAAREARRRRKIEDRRGADKEGLLGGGHTRKAGQAAEKRRHVHALMAGRWSHLDEQYNSSFLHFTQRPGGGSSRGTLSISGLFLRDTKDCNTTAGTERKKDDSHTKLIYSAHGSNSDLQAISEYLVFSAGGEAGGGDMVLFADWCLSPVIQRSACGMPMFGEDTGLEAVASPMVGYLGKVQERAASLDHCPCHTLHKPTVPVPLVSRPLEDVLGSLVVVEPATGNKRKSLQTIVPDEPSYPSPKRPRLKELDSSESQTSVSSDDNGVDICNGSVEEHVGAQLQGTETNVLEIQEQSKVILEKDSDSCEDAKNISLDKVDGDENLPQTIVNQEDCRLNGEDHSLANVVSLDINSLPDEDLSSSPVQNEAVGTMDNLCWLDSLLVALVNLRSLKNLKPKDEPEQSTAWALLEGYNEAQNTIQDQQQTDKDGLLKVPYQLLHKINADLKVSGCQSSIFCSQSFSANLVKKKLQCLLCLSCSKETVVKTLPTFTNIVPDWHPLRAVHFAPCNNCHRKNQRRKMVLQRVPPVFALHFVEGLPDNNIQIYNFSFRKKHYSVSAIIQYSSELKHFVTWVHRTDGSWVEFDDLKHPHSKSYKTLPVPAQEIHIVFWEEKKRQVSRACSPSTTFTESPPSLKNHDDANMDSVSNDSSQCSPDQSLLNPQNKSDIVDGVTEQDSAEAAEVDTTIGSTTLLDTFEGLTHNDIITLTLVELTEDCKKTSSNSADGDTEQDKEAKCQNRKSLETESEAVAEQEDNTEDDPTYEPKSKRETKRGKAAAAKQVKTPKVDAPKGEVVQSNSTPAPSKLVSPVSSTVPTPNVQKTSPPIQQEQKGWSDLLERSLGHVQNTSKLTSNQKPIAQVKRLCPAFMMPQQGSTVLPKVTPKRRCGRRTAGACL